MAQRTFPNLRRSITETRATLQVVQFRDCPRRVWSLLSVPSVLKPGGTDFSGCSNWGNYADNVRCTGAARGHGHLCPKEAGWVWGAALLEVLPAAFTGWPPGATEQRRR